MSERVIEKPTTQAAEVQVITGEKKAPPKIATLHYSPSHRLHMPEYRGKLEKVVKWWSEVTGHPMKYSLDEKTHVTNIIPAAAPTESPKVNGVHENGHKPSQ